MTYCTYTPYFYEPLKRSGELWKWSGRREEGRGKSRSETARKLDRTKASAVLDREKWQCVGAHRNRRRPVTGYRRFLAAEKAACLPAACCLSSVPPISNLSLGIIAIVISKNRNVLSNGKLENFKLKLLYSAVWEKNWKLYEI